MSDHPIHWHEGMFLTPQHFQAADRYTAGRGARGDRWDRHYNWGIRAIEHDEDALRNHRLVIRRLDARTPDGALLSFPQDGALPVVDLKEPLARSESVRVALALPLASANRPNVTDSAADPAARYAVEVVEWTDENTGADPQEIQVRRPNVRLLVSGDDESGYETLPLMRVRRAESASGVPSIDPTYIPPLLACDAWAPLRIGVLTRLVERIEKKASVLASLAIGRGLGFESSGQGEQRLLEQIRVLNAAISLMNIDLGLQGQSPLEAYRLLARLVGELSIFAPEMVVEALPPYDHDDLAACFLTARRRVEGLLDAIVEPIHEERVFAADSTQLRVELEPAWIDPTCQLILGVQTSLTIEEAERLLASGRNVKFGSARRADELFRLGEASLTPRPLLATPRALPVRRGLHYFDLAAEQAPEEWIDVERTLSLAARVGEHLVVDTLSERNEMILQHEGKSCTLKLTLFVLRDQPVKTEAPAPETATV